MRHTKIISTLGPVSDSDAMIDALIAAIIRDAESSPSGEVPLALRRSVEDCDHARALCAAAVMLADRGDAQAIVAVTRGVTTARRRPTLRPRAPILATTNAGVTPRRLALHWGVVPVCIGNPVDLSGIAIGRQLVAHGVVDSGQTVVFININHDLTRTDANDWRIQRL